MNKNSNDEKIISIFDSNIPRKINFSSFINHVSPLNLDKEIRQISKFNPYDTEIDNNYNNNFNRNYKKKEVEKTINYNDNMNHILFYESNNSPDYKIEEELKNSNLFIKKLNNYINISSDEEYHAHKNKKKNIEQYFISPKLNIRKNNEYTKMTQYSTNSQNDKDLYFTDLQKELKNIKIKSTNYSSNISYDYKDKKVKNENILNNIYENTYIEKKNKKIPTENKKMKKIPILRSTIQLSKTLKTIDEYMELKKSKSKHKHLRSKKRETIHLKNTNSSLKSKGNETNKKEKSKSKNKEKRNKAKNKNDNKNEILNEEIKLKKKYSNDNKSEDEKDIKNEKKEKEKKQSEDINNKVICLEDDNISKTNTQNKNSKSIPKVKSNKNFFFRSFLCCFGCDNFDDKEDENKFKIESPNKNNKINNKITNTDSNVNKLSTKKSRNKSNKIKRKKKES